MAVEVVTSDGMYLHAMTFVANKAPKDFCTIYKYEELLIKHLMENMGLQSVMFSRYAASEGKNLSDAIGSIIKRMTEDGLHRKVPVLDDLTLPLVVSVYLGHQHLSSGAQVHRRR